MLIALDTSVAFKWLKRGERLDAEANDLLARIQRREVDAVACEILSLEVVRGLKNVQARDPTLGFTDPVIEGAYSYLQHRFQTGEVRESYVKDVKEHAKDVEIAIGLYTADALHLATALFWKADYFAVDDHHFLTPKAKAYAASRGVQTVDLPALIAALNAAAPGPSAPTP